MCRCRHGKEFGQGDGNIRNRVSSSAIAWVARNIQGSGGHANRNHYDTIPKHHVYTNCRIQCSQDAFFFIACAMQCQYICKCTYTYTRLYIYPHVNPSMQVQACTYIYIHVSRALRPKTTSASAPDFPRVGNDCGPGLDVNLRACDCGKNHFQCGRKYSEQWWSRCLQQSRWYDGNMDNKLNQVVTTIVTTWVARNGSSNDGQGDCNNRDDMTTTWITRWINWRQQSWQHE